jgi:hypothetical protein
VRRAAAASARAAPIQVDAASLHRREGTYGEHGYEFLVSDRQCEYMRKHCQYICGLVDKFERFGGKFGASSNARVDKFEDQCVAAGWAADQGADKCKTREARSSGSIVGFTAASCGVNVILKPPYLWAKEGCREYTNHPIAYALAKRRWDSGGDAPADPAAAIAGMLADEVYGKLLENLHDLAVERYGEQLIEFLLAVVPREFRLGEKLVWNQCAMTGGSYQGHCKKHVDRFNLINALYHFTGTPESNVEGGATVFFKREDADEQSFAVSFENGRAIVGPFSKIEHGSSEYTGGRAVLGAYVDRRIVKFCLAFEWNREEEKWVAREERVYARLKEEYERFVEAGRL